MGKVSSNFSGTQHIRHKVGNEGEPSKHAPDKDAEKNKPDGGDILDPPKITHAQNYFKAPPNTADVQNHCKEPPRTTHAQNPPSSGSTHGAEPPEPSKPTQPPEPSKPTQPPEPSKPTQPPEPSKPPQPPEPSKPTQPPEPSKPPQ
jgi:hypothetical protein